MKAYYSGHPYHSANDSNVYFSACLYRKDDLLIVAVYSHQHWFREQRVSTSRKYYRSENAGRDWELFEFDGDFGEFELISEVS